MEQGVYMLFAQSGVSPPVYDVTNRETFDALPRWYSELETYVSGSVVKILVGNKVDKVRRLIGCGAKEPYSLLVLASHRRSRARCRRAKGSSLRVG